MSVCTLAMFLLGSGLFVHFVLMIIKERTKDTPPFFFHVSTLVGPQSLLPPTGPGQNHTSQSQPGKIRSFTCPEFKKIKATVTL